jgi:hypothetical protein
MANRKQVSAKPFNDRRHMAVVNHPAMRVKTDASAVGIP